MRILYDGVASGQVSSDEDAMRRIPDLKSMSNLAVLKSKLRDRLDDVILILDFNEGDVNDRQRAFIDCSKKWAAASILLAKNARSVGLHKMEQLLRVAKKFEFTEITVEVLRVLLLHEGTVTGNRLLHQEYLVQLKEYEVILSMENDAEKRYNELLIEFVNSKSKKKEIAQLASDCFEGIIPYLARSSSFKIHLLGRLVQIMVYDNLSEYQKTLQLCEEAIMFFEAKPYTSKSSFQVFYYSLMASNFNLGNYEDCRKVAALYKDKFELDTFNWYKLNELHFLAEMHAGNYTSAAQVWGFVVARPEFRSLPSQLVEIWKIFEAFLFFITVSEEIKLVKIEKNFKSSKFLNEFRVFPRDKSGMNIPILAIQFILSLALKEYGQCIDREEALAKYRTRYLSVDEAARSHHFFKLLEIIPKSGFVLKDIQSKAAPLLQLLKNCPINAGNQNFEVEIIPYELLWDMVVRLLIRDGK